MEATESTPSLTKCYRQSWERLMKTQPQKQTSDKFVETSIRLRKADGCDWSDFYKEIQKNLSWSKGETVVHSYVYVRHWPDQSPDELRDEFNTRADRWRRD